MPQHTGTMEDARYSGYDPSYKQQQNHRKVVLSKEQSTPLMILTVLTPNGEIDLKLNLASPFRKQLEVFCRENGLRMDLLDALENYVTEKIGPDPHASQDEYTTKGRKQSYQESEGRGYEQYDLRGQHTGGSYPFPQHFK